MESQVAQLLAKEPYRRPPAPPGVLPMVLADLPPPPLWGLRGGEASAEAGAAAPHCRSYPHPEALCSSHTGWAVVFFGSGGWRGLPRAEKGKGTVSALSLKASDLVLDPGPRTPRTPREMCPDTEAGGSKWLV